MKIRKQSPAVLLMAALVVAAQEDTSDGDSYLVDLCGDERFFCDSKDPTIFYRCVSQVKYTLHCPKGLHFSVTTQVCDWPDRANCSRGEGHTERTQGQDDRSQSSETSIGGQEPVKVVPQDQANARRINDTEADSSWIIKVSAAGKSWWRPKGIQPHQWQDISSITNPVFKPHIPEQPDSEFESDSGNEEEIISTKTPQKTSEPESSQSAAIEKSLAKGESSCGSSCQLPNCFCAGTAIPKGLPVASVPQMVMLTFDDEVSPAFYGYFQRLFRPGRYNPNGCPIRGCLFVSGSGTDYDLVYPLYAMGVEIASHTVSHRFPHTWWSSASYKDYVKEAVGMRNNLITRSGIPKESIKGFRVPFLQLGSDNMYHALYDSKFVYDSSMFTGSQWEGGEPVWPFTLDYVPDNTFCQHGPCPTKQYPGFWEIPVQRWYGLDGHSCAMPDGCTSTGDAEETLEYLKSNFRRFYTTNRAPFGIFIHARWFNSQHNLAGLDEFIDYLLTLDDVFFVPPSQVIDWMKKPTPLNAINGFEPWSCQGGAKDVWTEVEH